jgi:hypothetical protein
MNVISTYSLRRDLFLQGGNNSTHLIKPPPPTFQIFKHTKQVKNYDLIIQQQQLGSSNFTTDKFIIMDWCLNVK